MTSARAGLRRMTARDAAEEHRAATPLELFFDLVFVVAISLASAQLHHLETEGSVGAGIGAYLMVFFAIWWAWMNFTWFASAFDTDDWLYRVLTIVQMAGVLVLAAGTGPAMLDGDFLVVTVGYVIMRLALVTQWLRAAAQSPELKGTALRYAAGIVVVQALWVLRLLLPDQGGLVVFLVLVAADIAVPPVAERRRTTPWHPGHIAERYGLFTLIVLGESVLASTNAIVDAVEHSDDLAPLLVISACGLVVAAGMWWIYFAREHDEHLTGPRSAFVFGYGHYLVFAAAGAFSAGIEVAIDHDTHATELGSVAAAATLTVPVAVFILAVWALTLRRVLTPARSAVVVTVAVLVALAALAPSSLVLAAAGVVAIVVTLETSRGRVTPPLADS